MQQPAQSDVKIDTDLVDSPLKVQPAPSPPPNVSSPAPAAAKHEEIVKDIPLTTPSEATSMFEATETQLRIRLQAFLFYFSKRIFEKRE